MVESTLKPSPTIHLVCSTLHSKKNSSKKTQKKNSKGGLFIVPNPRSIRKLEIILCGDHFSLWRRGKTNLIASKETHRFKNKLNSSAPMSPWPQARHRHRLRLLSVDGRTIRSLLEMMKVSQEASLRGYYQGYFVQ